MADPADGGGEFDVDSPGAAFVQQQGDDLPCGPIAEQLPECFFMPGDGVALDQSEEVPLGVAAEGGLGEVRVVGQKALGRGAHVGEVAAPAAGDQDFLAGLIGMIEEQDPRARLARRRRRHKTCAARAKDDCIVVHSAS